MATAICVETDNMGVATLTLNHPPVNVLTSKVLHQLERTLAELAADDTVKVVIVTGVGRFFVSGADIRELAEIPSSQEGLEMARRGQAVLNGVDDLQKPVIAAINGLCLGGGLELAMCCHIRLAAVDASLGLPEIKLGLIPGFGGTQRLWRLIGRSKATELILTGDSVSSQDAKALGLVSEVFPAADLLPEARGLARKIASKGQLAVRAAVQALRRGAGLDLQDGLALEASLFSELFDSDDRTEGTRAFLEKRQPRFKA